MKRSVDLDDELASDVEKAASLVHEAPSVVIRLAIRAGLPSVTSRFQAPRPAGYFADDYPLPKDRQDLETATAKTGKGPDR